MRLRSVLILFVLGLISSCEEPIKRELEFSKPDLEDSEIADRNQYIPDQMLSLGSLEKYVPQEGNLFGRFYNERAEFFIIEKPLNKLYGSDVNSIVLCYLDGLLSKTTYFLEENVADDLIKRYGSFRISGHDFENRDLIKDRNIWEENGRKSLSKKLDNYRMAWTLGNQEISFKVNLNKKREQYVYIEMTDQYKRLLRVIEREY